MGQIKFSESIVPIVFTVVFFSSLSIADTSLLNNNGGVAL